MIPVVILASLVFVLGLLTVMLRTGTLRTLIGLALTGNAAVIMLGEFTQLHQGSSGPPLGQGMAFILICIICGQLVFGGALAVLLWRREIVGGETSEETQ